MVLVTSFRGGGAVAKMMTWLGGLSRFTMLVARHRPLLAYIHISAGASTFRKASFVAFARAARVPVLLHVHPANFFDQLSTPGIAGSLARRCLGSATAVIVLSEIFRDAVHAFAPGKPVHVVANAPDVDETSSADPTTERIPGRILCVGSFVDDKGVDLLVEAAGRIAPDFPALRIALAGAGPDEEKLRALTARCGLSDHTEFLGWLRGAALDDEYAHAALFVLPSRTEGLPLALLEAMWHGVPCVATTVGGVPELLSDGVGALVPPADPEALAGTMRGLLDDPLRAAALGAAAAERARARYTPSRQRRSIGLLLLHYSGVRPSSPEELHVESGATVTEHVVPQR